MAYLAITDPEIANGAVITQTLMHKNRDNLQAVCDDDASIPAANTLKRMGRQNAIIIGATDPGGLELLRVGGTAKARIIKAQEVAGSTPSFVLERDTVALWQQIITVGGEYQIIQTTPRLTINTSGAVTMPNGPLVVGTDPGGSELLRVGGDARLGGAGACRLSIGNNTSGNGGVRLFGSSAQVGWQIGSNVTAANALEFTPATAAGGTTFTTPALVINGSGAVTIGTDPGGSALLRVGGDVSIKVPMTWPAANATGILQNDGSGNLTWGNTGGSGTTVSFVPSVVSVSGGSAHTYGATRIARYWLVGKQVFFVINVGINVKDPTAANGVLLALLPLPAWNVYEYPIQVFIDNVNIAGYIGVIGRILPNNPARVALYKIATNGAQTELVMSDIAAFAYFSVSGSYIIP